MKAHRDAHASPSKKIKTNEYGVGVKNSVGKLREVMGERKESPSKMKKPPRKMA